MDTVKQKNKKGKVVFRALVICLIVFTALYFTAFKTLKQKSDRRTIYHMYGANYSDATLKRKIWWISDSNINRYTDLIGVAGASLCNDNNEILELIDRKGGEFILQNLRSAYMCEASNSIIFLEEKGFSVFDKDLQVPKFILRNAITHGEYSEKSKIILRTLLDRNEELKVNKELISMVEAIEVNEFLPKTTKLREELLSYFSQ